MASPLSQPSNKPISGKGKANYVRKSAAVVPTALPFKRQAEGSVLSSKVQPFSRGKTQSMSKVKKGGAD